MKNIKIIVLYCLCLVAISCGSVKKKDIYTVSEKKIDSVYYSSLIEQKPQVLSSLTINDICDSITNQPVKFKKQFIIKNDTIIIETVNDDLQISLNIAADIVSKQDSIIAYRDLQYKELKESIKQTNNIPFKYWVYIILSILLNAFLIYLLVKSKFSIKNIL